MEESVRLQFVPLVTTDGHLNNGESHGLRRSKAV